MFVKNRGIKSIVQLFPARRRCFAQVTFDRELFRKNRIRALERNSLKLDDSDGYNYLRKEVTTRLVDRLDDISRTFPTALELGSFDGFLYSEISDRPHYSGKGGIGGIETLVECDIAKSGPFHKNLCSPDVEIVRRYHLAAEEEFLPFQDHSFDLVLSSMSLHWVNDLSMAFSEIHRVLKPDGAFLCSMLGGDTLHELRTCLYLAEQERRGGMSPRVSPVLQASDVAGLLQSCDFTMPTVDVDTIQIAYPNAISLMEHIVGMGEGHCNSLRSIQLGRDTILAAAALYEGDGESILATFQVIHAIGWSPHHSQPKPRRRGSAKKSFHAMNHESECSSKS